MKFSFRNRKGQGTTEYIVILALVIAAVVLFWGKIKSALETQTTKTAGTIATAGN